MLLYIMVKEIVIFMIKMVEWWRYLEVGVKVVVDGEVEVGGIFDFYLRGFCKNLILERVRRDFFLVMVGSGNKFLVLVVEKIWRVLGEGVKV